jgi:predicted nucleic acid-binding protein
MSDRHFVDTNLLVYAHDLSTGRKHDKARELIESLWGHRSGVLSPQGAPGALCQLAQGAAAPAPRRGSPHRGRAYLRWEIVVNTGESVREAVDLETRYRLSFWDSLIVQAAAASGAEILYSEDLLPGQVYGTVRVVNPLAA